MGIKTLLRRFIQLIILLWVLSTITFILMKLTPGDPISQQLYASEANVSQAQLEAAKTAHGLNQSLIEQYGAWLGHIVRLDFGESYQTGGQVLKAIGYYAPPTFILSGLTVLVVLCVALPLGIYAAWHHQRTLDYTIRIGTSIAVSLPSFFLAVILIHVFAIQLHWLPIAGFSTPLHLILPVIALSVSMCAYYVRLVRVTLLELYQSREVEMARLRGLSERYILKHSLLKPMMIPVVTMLALSMGSLLGGTVVIENLFSIPGLGQFLVDSIRARDYPVIQGIVLLLGFVVVVSNAIGDLIVMQLDPKRRLTHRDLNENAIQLESEGTMK